MVVGEPQDLELDTHSGGVKADAANGPVSLRAHTDALQIWADKEVTVISVNAFAFQFQACS